MLDLESTKGIIFDYGGTIDTDGMHWSEVLWMAYGALKIPVDKDTFRLAYVHGERTLAKEPIIQPKHNFWHVLRLKAETQIQWLLDNDYLTDEGEFKKYTTGIADWCYAYVQTVISGTAPILKKLAEKYPMVLVTNFYGNMGAVLKDYHMETYFKAIVESAVVGVRKPDSAIFKLGISQLGFAPEDVIVIGDSYDKDIVPATKAGCKTIWLKGIGWKEYTGEETTDCVISHFAELKYLFKL